MEQQNKYIERILKDQEAHINQLEPGQVVDPREGQLSLNPEEELSMTKFVDHCETQERMIYHGLFKNGQKVWFKATGDRRFVVYAFERYSDC